jgi:hypothetical protein
VGKIASGMETDKHMGSLGAPKSYFSLYFRDWQNVEKGLPLFSSVASFCRSQSNVELLDARDSICTHWWHYNCISGENIQQIADTGRSELLFIDLQIEDLIERLLVLLSRFASFVCQSPKVLLPRLPCSKHM